MEAAAEVRLRLATQEDGKFIADSWLRSFKTANHVKRVPADLYWREHRLVISRLVDRSDVWIACDSLDPWTIWGWCCVERINGVVVLHYLYVKDALRGLRIASQMVDHVLSVAPTDVLMWSHDTRPTKKLRASLEDRGIIGEDLICGYNPYLCYREVHNGR